MIESGDFNGYDVNMAIVEKVLEISELIKLMTEESLIDNGA